MYIYLPKYIYILTILKKNHCKFKRNVRYCVKLALWDMFVRLSLLTMTNPYQLCDVLLFVCSKMADETNLSSKLPVADRTREV